MDEEGKNHSIEGWFFLFNGRSDIKDGNEISQDFW
jgi:hypothetical protein